ncbi:cell division cycle-associated protein 2 isoform X2 [Rhinatrema bivittatum]|nr:cell division cycle-associated protein 2 isoform X2 [Rhinatrema bivittatum]
MTRNKRKSSRFLEQKNKHNCFFQAVQKSKCGQTQHGLQAMKENMNIITDKDRDGSLSNSEDLDTFKSEKPNGCTETFEQIERHMTYEGVKSNVQPLDKTASTMGGDPSCASAVASSQKLESPVSEDKFFSTPKQCSGVLYDSEKLSTEASKEVIKPPIDFSTVTVDDLGITPDIFTIKSSENTNKSLLKARRRSTVGVRGSPETNFLIRYIAQQRSNTKMEPTTQVSHFRSPTVKSPYGSSLKEKMSVFRSSFQSVKESNGKISFPGLDEEGKESEATKTESRSPFKKQNEKTKLHEEPLSKKKRVATEGSFSLKPSEGRETESSIQLSYSGPCSIPKDTTCPGTAEEITKGNCFDSSFESIHYSRCSVSEVSPSLLATEGRDEWTFSPCGEREIVNYNALKQSGREKVTFAKHLMPEIFDGTISPCRPLQKDHPFLRPVLKKTPLKESLSTLEAHDHNLFAESTGFLESVETKAALLEETENIGSSNRKRVTFGRDLSPELFDTSLPANTPLRRGGTPSSHVESRTISPSFLETGISLSPFAQPNFDECVQLHVDSFEDGLLSGNPSYSDNFSVKEAVLSDATFEETSLANIRTTRKRKCTADVEKADIDTSSKSEYAKQQKFKEQQTKSMRPVNRNNQVTKGKNSKGKRGRRKKTIPKPLYGARELASKKPLLSPIVELPESSGTSSSSASWRLFQGDKLQVRDTFEESAEDDSKRKNSVTNSSRKIFDTDGSLLNTSKDEQVTEKNKGRQEPKKEGLFPGEYTQADEYNLSEVSNSSRMSFRLLAVINSTTPGGKESMKSPVMNTKEHVGNMGNDTSSTEKHSNIKLPWEDITSFSETAITEKCHRKKDSCKRRSFHLSEHHSLKVKHISHSDSRREVSLHLPNLVNQSMSCFSLGSTQQVEDVLSISSVKDTSQDAETKMEHTHNQAALASSPAKALCPKLEEHAKYEDSNSCYNRDCVLPFSAKEKSNIQSKARRNTIFCLCPESGIPESPLTSSEGDVHGARLVLPSVTSFENEPEAYASNPSFCIEDALQSVGTGDRKKVRRSMRLHKDSGISGLTWVEQSAPQLWKDLSSSSLKARRKTISIAALNVKANSPQTQKSILKFSAPDKENYENLPVLVSFSKPRQRRSICALTVEDTIGSSKPYQSRKSYSNKSTTTDVVRKELLAGKQIND